MSSYKLSNNIFVAIYFVMTLFLTSTLKAQDTTPSTNWYDEEELLNGASKTKSKSQQQLTTEQAVEAEKITQASAHSIRQFHEVLDELLAEFGYDVKQGQIKGLKNLALRKIKTSESIPKTYGVYLANLLSERIKNNSRIKLIECVQCKTRTSMVVDGKLLITSPATNIAKLQTAAAQLSIENFMDAVLIYHTTHMVLAVSVFNINTKEVMWSRSYNSETIKSRYQKLAIDYKQVAKSRPGEEYVPEYKFLYGLGAAAIPNVGGTSADSTLLTLEIRGTEKFNNRKSEFGLMINYTKTIKSIISTYPTTGEAQEETKKEESVGLSPKPYESAVTIYGLYGHLFVGALESYDEIRQGLFVAFGPMVTKGYLAASLKIGWDVYFGRRFLTTFATHYIAGSSILLGEETVKTKGGFGASVILSLNW